MLSPTGPAPHAVVRVARQAILDARGYLAGYQLLYSGRTGEVAGGDADVVGARLLADAVLDLRLNTVTDGRTAFIGLTRSLLLSGAATLLSPSAAVFELSGHLKVDAEAVDACRSLSQSGYRLALDDVVPGSPAEALYPFAAYVKVDLLRLSRAEVIELAQRLTDRGLQVVATNVETRGDFAWTLESGCSLFQGHYFCQPEIRSGGALPSHASQLRLLSALNHPMLTLDRLEELVKQDAVLSLRVLQCINSAAFAVRREIRSIREALVLLGVGPIRKWASVWCLAKLGANGPTELATIALLRARACELLTEGLPDVDGDEMFLVGLCSVLDTMVGRTMADATAGLPLTEAARAALLGESNTLRQVLDAVIAYERGWWTRALSAVEAAGADDEALSTAYAAALSWTHELSAATMRG